MRRAAVAAVCLALLAGCGSKLTPSPDVPATPASLHVTSPAFADGAKLPARFTCDGKGQSPPLSWSGVPAGADSLALVVDDPEAPGGDFVHWLVVDLRPGTTHLPAGSPAEGQVLENSAGSRSWTPPCPPSGTHQYRFTLYALDGVAATTDRDKLLAGIAGHAVAWGRLTATVSAS